MMNKVTLIKALCTCLFILVSGLLRAEGAGNPGAGNPNYWQCTTTDADNKSWLADGSYQLTAVNQAYATCKKESASPRTCKTAKNTCEHFINGHTTRPMWQCVALDRMATQWSSNYYPQQDDAALAAKAYCKDNSPIPGSCYINMITCHNINAEYAVDE
jgi:hypothetical protein